MIQLSQRLGLELVKVEDSMEKLYKRKAELEQELEQVNDQIKRGEGMTHVIKAVREMIKEQCEK